MNNNTNTQTRVFEDCLNAIGNILENSEGFIPDSVRCLITYKPDDIDAISQCLRSLNPDEDEDEIVDRASAIRDDLRRVNAHAAAFIEAKTTYLGACWTVPLTKEHADIAVESEIYSRLTRTHQ
ncbi:hypothetical protein [Sinorhizobium meliloti]|uniref:hypothetical protein n=1 Tax=Rhizobium meliloti TaxID=382 RepID=UPI00299D3F23|nr:hypothetical protein [Sinorhizobium meliloti]MDW9991072.1 hypothetical protein [Sinorhizobium meliloti]MDX0245472.1 hypothetical protein [Sinorhizobium meliloti]MDX0401524.1 hypothetical protein [Sinorhizobium meliloti]